MAEILQESDPVSLGLDGVLGLVSGPGHKSQTRNLLKRLDTLAIVAAVDVANLVESSTSDSTQCSQNVNRKGRREWATKIVEDVEKACGFRYHEPSAGGRRHAEFSVMLDHAARRLLQTHSWIKLAEAERNTFDKDARKIEVLRREHPAIEMPESRIDTNRAAKH